MEIQSNDQGMVIVQTQYGMWTVLFSSKILIVYNIGITNNLNK